MDTGRHDGVDAAFAGTHCDSTQLCATDGRSGAAWHLYWWILGSRDGSYYEVGGKFANDHIIRLLQLVPLVMGIVTLSLLGFGQLVVLTALLLAVWGAMNTSMSISWMA